MTRGRIPWLAGWLLPLIFALLSVPVAAQGPSVTLDSPASGTVVSGDVLFQGSAQDPDADLDRVTVTADGGGSRVRRFSEGTASATWEVTWDSQNVPDGRRLASVVARDEARQFSAPINITLIVDNDKEPGVRDVDLSFDTLGDGIYARWWEVERVPTTRLSFELEMTEEMDEASLRGGLSFVGGQSSWQLAPMGGPFYWVNVSYLEANTSYNLTVASSATDLAGNLVVEVYEFVFRTAVVPTPGTSQGPGGFGSGLILPFSLDSPGLWVGIAVAVGVVGLAVAWRKGFLTSARQRLGRLRERGAGFWRSDEDDE